MRSRATGTETHRLESWGERAMTALDAGPRERGEDPLTRQLDEAKYRIGELSMEIEILSPEPKMNADAIEERLAFTSS